jgi:hypothetical protein
MDSEEEEEEHTLHEEEDKEKKVRCKIETLAKTKCKHDAKWKGMCLQHYKMETQREFAPWEELKFPTPPNLDKMMIADVNQLRAAFCFFKYRTGPSLACGGEGFIYMYRLVGDANPDFWKIGYTERRVEERLDEWCDHYGGKVTIKYDAFPVKNRVRLVETFIHRYLAQCCVLRRPVKNSREEDMPLFKSEWKRGEIIKDEQRRIIDEKDLSVERQSEREWFCIKRKEAKELIQQLVVLLELQ